MINQSNYDLAQQYLEYLDEVCQLEARCRKRQWLYLKYLLIWAGETSFDQVTELRPTFPAFLATVRLAGDGGTLAPARLKRIIQAAKRFFVWLKLAYLCEYQDVPLAWIEALQPLRNTEHPAEDDVAPRNEYEDDRLRGVS